jgi:F0F1-type ATP synthase alpha subunit
MLKQTLISINSVIDTLIEITLQDIDDIKKANHDALFDRNIDKYKIISEFTTLKKEIDSILVKRSESGLDISQMLSPEEDKLLSEFKEKLSLFMQVHKKFSKLLFTITNFYNNLVNKVTEAEVDIGYQMKSNSYQSNFSLKG